MNLWPPQYTLKKSARARHIRLKTSVRHGLQLIVPLRFNVKHVPEILEKNKAWIEKQITQLQKKQLSIDTTLPTELFLPSVNQAWKIHYLAVNSQRKIQIITRPQQELVFLGNIDNIELLKMELNQWLRDLAKIHLTTRAEILSQQTKLTYESITIRGQRGRWGSCSVKKRINLNYKLLFLPPHLVDHIIIHELCHTKHMNHSARFWQLVATFDPQWKENSRSVRHADKLVPAWCEVDE